MKLLTVSSIALVAMASTALGADLGTGNADLEERVAELEATAARKGTRKTTLEVWGQVNKAVIAWSDGSGHNVNLGTDNTNSSTRFGFRGQSKISATVNAGYSVVIDTASGARSATFSQGGDRLTDARISMREANWWIESATLGRATVGRFVNPAAPQGAIDLGGISLAAGSSMSLVGGSLMWNTGAGLSPVSLANSTDQGANYGTRENGVNWVSPTFAGFSVAVSAGGAVNDDTANGVGLTTGAALKYVNEFDKTIRLAAAVGYERSAVQPQQQLTVNAGGASTNLGYSLSAMHVPTGLFAQGFYNTYVRGDGITGTNTATQWMAQAGISKNWFGVGATAPYVEYGKAHNGLNAFLLPAFSIPAAGVPDSNVTMLGAGITQNLDAAAMTLYASYRNFKASSDLCTSVDGCKNIDLFMAGAAIKF